MNNYKVYKHTFPNNKVYIGITCQKYINTRWKNGNGYKTQPVFNAIKKYGWENIKHEILFNKLTKEEAIEKEIELIAFYKSNNIKFGYNMESGGTKKGEISQETRLKLRQGRLGKVTSLETKKILSKINTGKKLSSESRQKISKANKGRKNTLEQNKKISIYQSNRPKEHNLKISLAKKGKKKTLNHIIKLSKPVLQLNEEGVIIKRFYGLHYACNQTEISFKNIQSCCIGRRKRAGGYRWQYE